MALLIPENLRTNDDVPASIRKVARAFQQSLDDSATVWYEPLYDPSQERPHLIILMPDIGIAVIEVAKVTRDQLLGVMRGKMHVTVEGIEKPLPSPAARAETITRDFKHHLEQADIEIPVSYAVVLANLLEADAGEKHLERVLDVRHVLHRDLIDAALSGEEESTLLRFFSRLLIPAMEEPLSREEEKRVRAVIQPDTVIHRSHPEPGRVQDEELFIAQPDDLFAVMDRQQERLAKGLGTGHRLIRGVAGSGKTLILLHRARLLHRLNPNAAILVTCYNKSLASLLSQLLINCSSIDVDNLDRIMWRVTKDAGLKFPGYESEDADVQVASTATHALRTGAGRRYRYILVDEAQDFCTEALKFILSLFEPGHDDLLIVADAAQNIFRRKFSWRDAGINVVGRSRVLKKNYRNTRQILEFAYRFLTQGEDSEPESIDEETEIIRPEASLREGPNPQLSLCASREEEFQAILEKVDQWKDKLTKPRQLAILYACRSVEVEPLYNALKQRDPGVFWMNEPGDRDARRRVSSARSSILLSTIDSAKGFEFAQVILTSLERSQSDQDSLRNLIYVGMTRATQDLVVLVGTATPMVDEFQKLQRG